jgi:ribosome maturation factor RimP
VGESPLFSWADFLQQTDAATHTQIAENMALDLEKVRQIAERVAGSSGMEVVEVEVSGAGKHRILRIFIDRVVNDRVEAGSASPDGVGREVGAHEGVTHEDCANFSREFGTIVDVEDAVPGGSYVLEVSSPGLDRKLTKAADFERFRGQRVKLMTREPVNDNRHFEGKLESFENGKLLLDLSAARKKKMRPKEGDSSKIEIEFRNVEKANLVPEI